MAHDYIDIGSFSLRLNDFHIWTLHHFMCRTIEQSSPSNLQTDSQTLDAIKAYLDSWQWLGPGIIVGSDFNEFATEPSQWRLVSQLLSATRARLVEIGEFIPLEYLDSHVNSAMASYLESQPTEIFTDIIDRLQSFLTSQFKD